MAKTQTKKEDPKSAAVEIPEEAQEETQEEGPGQTGVDATLEALQQKVDEIHSRRMANFFSPTEGSNRIRILPPTPGSTLFFHETFNHWIQTAQRSSVCLQKMFGKPCYICEMRARLTKAGDQEGARQLNARPRYLMSVMDINNLTAGLQVYAAPSTVFEQIVGYCLDEEWGLAYDATSGYDLYIDRSGSGLNTKYSVRPSRKATAVEASWIEDLPNLSKMVQPHSYDIQKAMYEGGGAEGTEASDTGSNSDLPWDKSASGKSVPQCMFEFDSRTKSCQVCEWGQQCKLGTLPNAGQK